MLRSDCHLDSDQTGTIQGDYRETATQKAEKSNTIQQVKSGSEAV